MKKMLIALLILALCAPAALAEMTLVDGFAVFPAEAAMTEYLAQKLAEKWDSDVTVIHAEDGSAAVNAFLALPAGETALISNQEAMIESLTQYNTDEDMRTALLPVTCVAASGSSFYASSAAAETLEEKTMDALIAYTEENPYELFIARMVEVDANDYLVLEASQDLYVDQNTYLDYDEAAQAAQAGAPDLIVFSDGMRPAAAQAYEKLFSTELPGVWQGVFVSAEGAEALAEKLAAALSDICQTEEWAALLSQGGYESAPLPERAQFEEDVKDLFAAYVRYLTNEGLFFYEQ